MLNRKILITGKSGFLGTICHNYLSTEHIVDSLGRGKENTIQFSLMDSDIEVVQSYELVVHIAGKAHLVPKTSEEKKDFFDVNVLGTQNFLYALQEAPNLPKSFVFISSVSVYGLDEGENISEDHPLNAENSYGLSKIQAEQLVETWCKKNAVTCTILRLPLVVAKNPPGNLGAMIKGLKKGYYMNIAGGKAKKSMVMALDVAKFIVSASEVGGIFNLTDGYHPSFYELSANLAKQLGKPTPLNIPNWLANLLAKTGDLLGHNAPFNSYKLSKITADLTFDDSKARKAFGWKPTSVLESFKVS
jgi:nucleoside-diphosphate-sugar epimerase